MLIACSNEKQDNVQSEQSLETSTQVQDRMQFYDQTAESTNRPDPVVLYSKCATCHGKDGKSIAPGSVGNVLIATLNKAQVTESLKGFRNRTLSKGGNSVIMYMQTKNLSDEDIDVLATYIDGF